MYVPYAFLSLVTFRRITLLWTSDFAVYYIVAHNADVWNCTRDIKDILLQYCIAL